MSRVGTVIFLLFLACAAAAVEVDFQANVNVSVNGSPLVEADIDAAALKFRLMTTTPLINGLLSASVLASAEGVDIEVDSAHQTSNGPITINAHYNTEFTLPTLLSFDASSSVNFIATFPYAIVEVDANGGDVLFHKISDFTWSTTNDLTVAASNALKLAVKAFAGTKVVNGTECTLYFYVQGSAQLGVSDFLNQDLVPKTWAFTMELSDYTLQSVENSLRIQYAAATGNAIAAASGQLTISGPEPKLQAYVDLAATAIFDGNGISVEVQSFAEAGIDLSSLFPQVKTQLDAKYDANVKVFLCNVTFEAGSNGFTHNGRSGTGLRLNQVSRNDGPSGGASSLSICSSLLLALISLTALLL